MMLELETRQHQQQCVPHACDRRVVMVMPKDTCTVGGWMGLKVTGSSWFVLSGIKGGCRPWFFHKNCAVSQHIYVEIEVTLIEYSTKYPLSQALTAIDAKIRTGQEVRCYPMDPTESVLFLRENVLSFAVLDSQHSSHQEQLI